MNVLDLFSGIGGFSLGLERAGMRTVAFCERDEYCRAVLRKHWPHVPCFEDIHSVEANGLDRLGRIDVVCGGFPCQPFSVAGKQKGKDDDRHLWPEMCRIIALARPTWVIAENVAGLIAMALDDVLVDLESLGYTARTIVIPACAVGAPHRRDRLWIIAADSTMLLGGAFKRNEPNGNVQRPEAMANTDGVARHEGWPRNRTQEQRRRDIDRSRERENVCYSHSEGLALRQSKHHNNATELATTVGTDWWSAEPDVGRVAHGIPRRVDRLRTLGNAVVPQIVEEIGRAIVTSVLNEKVKKR